jgi:rRNA-processing protein FCF1
MLGVLTARGGVRKISNIMRKMAFTRMPKYVIITNCKKLDKMLKKDRVKVNTTHPMCILHIDNGAEKT